MKRKYRFLSLTLALAMLAFASVSVHHMLFGHSFGGPEGKNSGLVETDSITRNADGSVIIHTASLDGTETGYNGPIPVDIEIKDGRISSITPLPNEETPSFFKRASVLFESWIGKTPDEALKMEPDAVSGATYSSVAIISNVNAGLNCYLGSEKRNRTEMPWRMWIALGVSLAACVFPLFVRNRAYRYVQMIANIVVLGFWCGTFLDYSRMLKYMSEGFALPAGLVAIVMLVAAFVYPLFGHPQHYCNHICPLGSAQLLVAELCGYKIRLSKKVLKGLDWFRRILWAVLMILLWADCLTEWMDLELFQAFQFESAAWYIIVAACLFTALSAVISRPYCRFICPTGSLFKFSENFR